MEDLGFRVGIEAGAPLQSSRSYRVLLWRLEFPKPKGDYRGLHKGVLWGLLRGILGV